MQNSSKLSAEHFFALSDVLHARLADTIEQFVGEHKTADARVVSAVLGNVFVQFSAHHFGREQCDMQLVKMREELAKLSLPI